MTSRKYREFVGKTKGLTAMCAGMVVAATSTFFYASSEENHSTKISQQEQTERTSEDNTGYNKWYLAPVIGGLATSLFSLPFASREAREITRGGRE